MSWKSLLSSIRFPNLLILSAGFLVLLIRHFLPSYRLFNIPVVFDLYDYLLFTVAASFVLVSGYFQNDFIDRQSDEENSKIKPFIWSLSGRKFRLIYWSMIIIPLPLVAYLGFKSGFPLLILLYPMSILLISWYNIALKKRAFTGNLMVGFLCSMPFLLVPSIELKATLDLISIDIESSITLFSICLMFAIFAFLSTLSREIIKDVIDIDGDRGAGYSSLAIRHGLEVARKTALSSYILLLLSLLFCLVFWPLDSRGHGYFVIMIIIPALIIIYGLIRSHSVSDYKTISLLCKAHFVAGLCYLYLIGSH